MIWGRLTSFSLLPRSRGRPVHQACPICEFHTIGHSQPWAREPTPELLLKCGEEDSLSTEITERSGRKLGAITQEELTWIKVIAKQKKAHNGRDKTESWQHDLSLWIQPYLAFWGKWANKFCFFGWPSLAGFGPLNGKDLDDHDHHNDPGWDSTFPKRPLHYNGPPNLRYALALLPFLTAVIALPGFHTLWEMPMARHFLPSTLQGHMDLTAVLSPPWHRVSRWRGILTVCTPRAVSGRNEGRGLADCPTASSLTQISFSRLPVRPVLRFKNCYI